LVYGIEPLIYLICLNRLETFRVLQQTDTLLCFCPSLCILFGTASNSPCLYADRLYIASVHSVKCLEKFLFYFDVQEEMKLETVIKRRRRRREKRILCVWVCNISSIVPVD